MHQLRLFHVSQSPEYLIRGSTHKAPRFAARIVDQPLGDGLTAFADAAHDIAPQELPAHRHHAHGKQADPPFTHRRGSPGIQHQFALGFQLAGYPALAGHQRQDGRGKQGTLRLAAQNAGQHTVFPAVGDYRMRP